MPSENASPGFCTGYGASDTHALILNNGNANPHSSAGQPYDTISAAAIHAMVLNPPSAPKEQGQWFIPSAYHEHDARSHAVQRTQGRFHWLAADIDKGSPTLETVAAAVRATLPGVAFMIYSSRSAKPGELKWRVLVYVEKPLSGYGYSASQKEWFDLLEAKGLELDRSLERTGQPIYLPNEGEYYDHHIEPGVMLQPDAEVFKAAREKLEAASEAMQGGGKRGGRFSPIAAFNRKHSIAEMLEVCGYAKGSGAHWRSPYQDSGSYATQDCDEMWISLSDSDAKAGLGRPTNNGNRAGDAFDLYKHYKCGGDEAAALVYANKILKEELELLWGAATVEHGREVWEAIKQIGGRRAKRKAVEFVDFWAQEAKPVEWLIDGIIPAKANGLLFGAPKSGKSFIALDWALCVATGTEFLGREVQQGDVVYIAGEGHGGLNRRRDAWLHHHGIAQDMQRGQFLLSTRAVDVPKQSEALIDEIAACDLNPKLIVVDTVARNFGGGDENSNQDMSAFVLALDKLAAEFPEATILSVHHTGLTETHRPRGASALTGAIDFSYHTHKHGDNNITLKCAEMKDASDDLELSLALHSVGASMVVIEGSGDGKSPPTLNDRQRTALDLLLDLAADGGDMTVAKEVWRAAFYKTLPVEMLTDTKLKAFKGARERLVALGFVIAGVGGDTLHPSHKGEVDKRRLSKGLQVIQA